MSFDNKQITGASSDDQGSGINHWLRLSDEMALDILRHLPKKSLKTVSLINKKFRDLSRDDSLWTELTLDYKDIKRNADSCGKLVERCKKLASLKISNESFNSETLNIMTVVIRAKESLKSLEVRYMKDFWTPAAMTKLCRLKNLTSLALTISTEAKIMEEFANLDKLEVLNLKIGVPGYHDSLFVMKSVFKKLKKLKKVKINFYFYLEDGDVGEDCLCFVVSLAKNNPDLTVLQLTDYPSLSDETLAILANSCPGLEEFRHDVSSEFDDLYYGVNRTITDSGIERMVGAAKNLKHLHLVLGRGRASRVTEDLVKRLREEYPDLDVTLTRITFEPS